MFSTDDLKGAIIDIICYYYVLDISYPKVMYALLIFLQHFVFCITDSGTIPAAVIVYKASIKLFSITILVYTFESNSYSSRGVLTTNYTSYCNTYNSYCNTPKGSVSYTFTGVMETTPQC